MISGPAISGVLYQINNEIAVEWQTARRALDCLDKNLAKLVGRANVRFPAVITYSAGAFSREISHNSEEIYKSLPAAVKSRIEIPMKHRKELLAKAAKLSFPNYGHASHQVTPEEVRSIEIGLPAMKAKDVPAALLAALRKKYDLPEPGKNA